MRPLLIGGWRDVAAVGFAVGYSASQFSSTPSVGTPPQDAVRLRQQAETLGFAPFPICR